MLDMTKGKPINLLIKFSLPLMLSSFLQQMYGITDAAVLGNFVGADALAAVSVAFPITFTMSAVLIGFSTGASILVSQYFGAKNYPNLNKAVSTLLVLLTLTTVVFSIICLFIYEDVFVMLGTPTDILPQTLQYMRIIILGFFFSGLYNACSGLFMGMGDTKTPMMSLVLSTAVHISLNLILVGMVGMGIEGSAIATISAQATSGVFCLYRILKKITVLDSLKPVIYKVQALKLLQYALPVAMQMAFLGFGFTFVQISINAFGTEAIAACGAATRVISLATLITAAFGHALTAYTGQNFGAKNMARIKSGLISSLMISCSIAVVITILLRTIGGLVLQLFVPSTEPEVLQLGIDFLNIVSVVFVVNPLMSISQGVLNGVGFTIASFLTAVCGLGSRMIATRILSQPDLFGFEGIAIAMPFDWFAASAMGFLCYFGWHIYMKKKGKIPTQGG